MRCRWHRRFRLGWWRHDLLVCGLLGLYKRDGIVDIKPGRAAPAPDSETASRYVVAVMTKLGGTGSPAVVSSPRLAPFPPTSATSVGSKVSIRDGFRR
jgi:hypothetical protein